MGAGDFAAMRMTLPRVLTGSRTTSGKTARMVRTSLAKKRVPWCRLVSITPSSARRRAVSKELTRGQVDGDLGLAVEGVEDDPVIGLARAAEEDARVFDRDLVVGAGAEAGMLLGQVADHGVDLDRDQLGRRVDQVEQAVEAAGTQSRHQHLARVPADEVGRVVVGRVGHDLVRRVGEVER